MNSTSVLRPLDDFGTSGSRMSSPGLQSDSDLSRPVSLSGGRSQRIDSQQHSDRSLSGTPAGFEVDGSGSDYSRGRSSNHISRSSSSLPSALSSASPSDSGSSNVHAFVDILGSKLELSHGQIGDLHSLANVRSNFKANFY